MMSTYVSREELVVNVRTDIQVVFVYDSKLFSIHIKRSVVIKKYRLFLPFSDLQVVVI